MLAGKPPFTPMGNPEETLNPLESMRVEHPSREDEALDREGIERGEPERKTSRSGFWTRTRMVAVLLVFVVVLMLVVSVVVGWP
jgi:hypothetical protein